MPIRAATADDIDDIQQVAEASWRADYPEMLNRENVDEVVNEWYDPGALADELERADSMMFVAEADGGVVGFSHAVSRPDEGHILRVYVAPGYRGKGRGRALLERTRDELFERGVDRVKAMVLDANQPGNEFYESVGFEPTDTGGETEIGGERYEENVYVYERPE